MSKTKWWVVTLATILVLVVLAVGGYAVYRLGYSHGLQGSMGENDLPRRLLDRPFLWGPHLNLREFGRGYMMPGRGIFMPVLFSWLRFILPLAVLGIFGVLVVLLIVTLGRKNGRRRVDQKPLVEQPKNAEDLEHKD